VKLALGDQGQSSTNSARAIQAFIRDGRGAAASFRPARNANPEGSVDNSWRNEPRPGSQFAIRHWPLASRQAVPYRSIARLSAPWVDLYSLQY
jgi:hypothetical protein